MTGDSGLPGFAELRGVVSSGVGVVTVLLAGVPRRGSDEVTREVKPVEGRADSIMDEGTLMRGVACAVVTSVSALSLVITATPLLPVLAMVTLLMVSLLPEVLVMVMLLLPEALVMVMATLFAMVTPLSSLSEVFTKLMRVAQSSIAIPRVLRWTGSPTTPTETGLPAPTLAPPPLPASLTPSVEAPPSSRSEFVHTRLGKSVEVSAVMIFAEPALSEAFVENKVADKAFVSMSSSADETFALDFRPPLDALSAETDTFTPAESALVSVLITPPPTTASVATVTGTSPTTVLLLAVGKGWLLPRDTDSCVLPSLLLVATETPSLRESSFDRDALGWV